jgi:hypothetical protein
VRSVGNTTALTFNNTSTDRATYSFKTFRKDWFTPWFRLNTNNSGADDSLYYRIDGGDWITLNNVPAGSGWRWVNEQTAMRLTGRSDSKVHQRYQDALSVLALPSAAVPDHAPEAVALFAASQNRTRRGAKPAGPSLRTGMFSGAGEGIRASAPVTPRSLNITARRSTPR